ncbi:hypothetical protein ERJ75_001574700 [Trypanosoma vivax]|nr:hypothetical protein ERJ75_001574700 [Trypanosoma vivax]
MREIHISVNDADAQMCQSTQPSERGRETAREVLEKLLNSVKAALCDVIKKLGVLRTNLTAVRDMAAALKRAAINSKERARAAVLASVTSAVSAIGAQPHVRKAIREHEQASLAMKAGGEVVKRLLGKVEKGVSGSVSRSNAINSTPAAILSDIADVAIIDPYKDVCGAGKIIVSPLANESLGKAGNSILRLNALVNITDINKTLLACTSDVGSVMELGRNTDRHASEA